MDSFRELPSRGYPSRRAAGNERTRQEIRDRVMDGDDFLPVQLAAFRVQTLPGNRQRCHARSRSGSVKNFGDRGGEKYNTLVWMLGIQGLDGPYVYSLF